ncbi:rod shape-determining protein [Candidatus Saccharibacteria bacterium]|nr:rod shape-determining protein [Candidatus Saccharibacteria bacterium]
MKFPKFSKKSQNTDQYLVALDIGTEYVKALIGQVVEGKDEKTGKREQVVEIIGSGRQRQRLTDMSSGAITDIAGVVENCDAALRRAEEMAGCVAKDAVLGIAGELVKGGTTTVSYRRAKPNIKIDQAELMDIIERIQKQAFDAVRKQLSWETGKRELEVKLVNAAVVDVYIDGYRVTNPVGFQGKDVTIQIFNAFAPMVHLGALQTVAADLDLNCINIAAEPFAVAKSVGAEDSTEFSAIFIDIGGGTSDIAVVNNGGVEGTQMFAIGGRSFTKRISSALGVGFDKAEELKLQHSAGKLTGAQAKEVTDALASDVETWLSGVELSLSEFDNLDHLPTRILLCGGGSALPEIKKALSHDHWYKNLAFARKPSIDFVSPKEVNRVVDKTGNLNSPQEITPMGLANLGLDIVGSQSMGENILQRLSRTLSL